MDDVSATRIEPLATSVDIERRSPPNGSSRKRPNPDKAEKPSSSPSLESLEAGDPVEEIHQIDELA